MLLSAGWLGCRQAPVETPATEEPGQAVIYPEGAQAEKDIAAALAKAAKEKKRVLIDFGGNWCGDCQVLEIYFHDPANRGLLEQNYVLVPVNIGRYDENMDIAAKYGVPVSKGVPALAVLDAERSAGVQPAQRGVPGDAENGLGFGDCLPSPVEGLAWPGRWINSASP